ncbi:MAG: hypothetical protein ABI954_02935 [Pyrinomonadaceae bacterium]
MCHRILQVVFIIVLVVTTDANLTASATTDFPALSSSAKCAAPGTAREALQNSAAVFIGKINELSESDDVITLKFNVERYWKGNKSKTQTVIVNTGPRYSPSLTVGERYIVYAYQDSNGQLTFGRCSRTKLAEYADDDIRALGEGKKP